MIYSVLDFETTGLGPRESRVLEVGITKITGAGEILDSYETLINPDNEPVGATHIHGITR
ncbi:MAG: 3'-5' exonuclease, partial [Spirochaetia bacterium]|nr:3'-5' exonuclease [Spirochaetia bacterium]